MFKEYLRALKLVIPIIIASFSFSYTAPNFVLTVLTDFESTICALTLFLSALWLGAFWMKLFLIEEASKFVNSKDNNYSIFEFRDKLNHNHIIYTLGFIHLLFGALFWIVLKEFVIYVLKVNT